MLAESPLTAAAHLVAAAPAQPGRGGRRRPPPSGTAVEEPLQSGGADRRLVHSPLRGVLRRRSRRQGPRAGLLQRAGGALRQGTEVVTQSRHEIRKQ